MTLARVPGHGGTAVAGRPAPEHGLPVEREMWADTVPYMVRSTWLRQCGQTFGDPNEEPKKLM